jgi:hypothetical protein
LVRSESLKAGSEEAPGHQEPSTKGFGFLLVVRPAVVKIPPQCTFEVEVNIGGMAEHMMAKLMSGRISLARPRMPGVQHDSSRDPPGKIYPRHPPQVRKGEDDSQLSYCVKDVDRPVE